MEKEKLVSVIVPVYNCEEFLHECLNSVVCQTYENLEIIIVDDGSTDDSLKICEDFAWRDSRIRILSQKNAGVAAARNHALSMANGELILFVDADDVIFPNICKIAVDSIRDYDVLMFGYVSGQTCSEVDLCRGTNPEVMALDGYSTKDWVSSLLGSKKNVPLNANLNTVWGKLYRRSFLEDHQIRFTDGVIIGEDLLFNLSVLINYPQMCFFPDTGYFYRDNATSVVHRYSPKVRESYLCFLQEMTRILDERQLADTFREEVGYQMMYALLQMFSRDVFHQDNPKSEKSRKSDFLDLVSREEIQNLIPCQLKNFGLVKRWLLLCAKNKWYYPIKVMFLLKDWSRRRI